MITRRRFVQNTCLAATGCGLAGAASAAGGFSDNLAADLAKIEQACGGRLGVAVLDTLTGIRSRHRADERFPMCSTFKLLAAGAILARVDAGKDLLERRIRFEPRDVVAVSHITKERTGGEGMTVAELCEAAITVSDNTAANLLLAVLDGPAGLTAYARSLGDPVTRLDRIEPELNEAIPGDPRDTTSPAAMLSNLQLLVLGNALSAAAKDQLRRWLIANKTGDARLRAGLPSGWRVGDRTGSGEHGTTNDIGIMWPPERAPILVAVYLTETSKPDAERNVTMAAVGRAIATRLER
ncbi:MAG TPA: class A beta-lactamase [Xanthobacteraceae bacterium]